MKLNAQTLLLAYFVCVNLLGFALMGIDKRQARKHLFRISEGTLFTVAIIGGAAGSLLGMYVFRHKTLHRSFVFGMPAILILQIAAIVFLSKMPFEFITL